MGGAELEELYIHLEWKTLEQTQFVEQGGAICGERDRDTDIGRRITAGYTLGGRLRSDRRS